MLLDSFKMMVAFASDSVPDTTNSIGNSLAGLMPVLIIVAVMYFFIIKPQNKRQNETEKMLQDLKVGDLVSTVSGIIGEIAEINIAKNTILLKANENVTLAMHKKAVVENMSRSIEDSQDKNNKKESFKKDEKKSKK